MRLSTHVAVAALSFWPQFADHMVWDVSLGVVLESRAGAGDAGASDVIVAASGAKLGYTILCTIALEPRTRRTS